MHLQGSLDGLCGAYAVINSLTLMVPKIDAELLFSGLISSMGQRLATAILAGMSTTELRKLVLAPCADLCRTQGLIVRYRMCRCDETLAAYWRAVQAHHARYGAGSIVLGIAGGHDHWTCVRRVTDKTMLLEDSAALTRLYRRHVSVDAGAKYQLRPRDTFLITVNRC
jgi:hypothetical protein